ncbi:MAG TPA: LLM class flavin-dependent oxidoreductase [Thermomicrobiales bacterium]|nr:LLM class flavin-dependent oxidoreductase [Thermomicrobiales bacterium]
MTGGRPAMGRPRMRLGLCTAQVMDWDTLVERWRRIEAFGFDSAWLFDHFMGGADRAGNQWYLEGWTALAGLAMATSRVDIGVLVSGNTYRPPALLAKEALTVDHISNGRLILGLGAGWYEAEHEAYGFAFPSAGERVARFREAVELVEALLTEHRATYAGDYYRLRDAPSEPKALRSPGIPLLFGTSGPKMLRIAAAHADVWNMVGTPEQIHERGKVLLEACAQVGRDPATIRWSAAAWPGRVGFDPLTSPEGYRDLVERYREVGVTEVLCSWGKDTPIAAIERIAAELPALQAPR